MMKYKYLPLHYKNRKEALRRDPEKKTHNESYFHNIFIQYFVTIKTSFDFR